MRRTVIRLAVVALCGIIPIAVFLQLPMGTWDQIGGLPNHPLVVHLVVVLVPVVGIWAIVAAWRPRVLERTFPALFGAAVVCALATIVAKSSGDSLTAAVGLPKAHAAAGDRLVSLSIALAAVILVLGAVSQLWPRRVATIASGVLVTIVGVLSVPFTYVAGHTGAEATWEERYAEARRPIGPGDATYTIADVARRATREECWTIVDGSVYDVTSFITRHPAGSADIIEMCGRDASDSFLGQHRGQGEPEEWLATLRIGTLRD